MSGSCPSPCYARASLCALKEHDSRVIKNKIWRVQEESYSNDETKGRGKIKMKQAEECTN